MSRVIPAFFRALSTPEGHIGTSRRNGYDAARTLRQMGRERECEQAMQDSRRAVRSLVAALEFSSWRALGKIAICFALASLAALGPEFPGLTPAARWALWILIFAAGLWITEAIPAFAVGLLVIGLEIAILGRPGGVFAEHPDDWERFIAPWGDPLIWLFFGGFVLAAAAEKTGLTQWLARLVLSRLGSRPPWLLLGSMGVTFVFSMFISNTAAAMMMIAVMVPVTGALAEGDRFRKALLLGVAFAANIGGMGTVIGTPPNAIAAGALRDVAPIDFAGWMLAAAPPAVLLLAVAWLYLLVRYPAAQTKMQFTPLAAASAPNGIPLWQRLAVIAVFAATVLLWLTQSLHGVPATVISFLPICVFTAIGLLDANDICGIRWDVLLLIAGGLALGVAVTDTGLAAWLVEQLPLAQLGVLGLALILSYTTALLSNLMSNTAAANILVPIAVVAAAGAESQTVIPLALGASAAMCLPISTPPNAIVYGTGQLEARDLLQGGLVIGLLAPLLATGWCWLVFG